MTVQQYILKVHSRCDLSCDHCYIYESVDQSWRKRTKAMSAATVQAAAERIGEHARVHHLDRVDVILHGGEPLLLGPEGIFSTVQALHQVLGPPLQLTVHLQTNAVRLDEVMCETLAECDVKVGVSLDGDRQANDRHRRFANGASSHEQVRRALALLRRPGYRSIYAGLLCTVDIKNDPIHVYEALRREDPPRIDFLLPHATWEHPPVRPAGVPTPYADWLRCIHEQWTRDGKPMPVRLFDSLLAVSEGGPSGTESTGPSHRAMAVIETDGEWEQIDTLKVTYAGAGTTGLNVHEHSVDEVAASVGLLNFQGGASELCQTCRDCAVVQRCGGGLLAHRFRPENGFDNPSVFCADLKKIVTLVQPAPLAPGRAQDETRAVPGPLVDDLAAGRLGADSLALITGYQRAVDRTLFELLAPLLAERDIPGWTLLARLRDEAPAAAAAAIAHPYSRVWARDCHQALHTPGKTVDLGYLATLAAAAAIGAQYPTELVVPVTEGLVRLPGLGTVSVGAGVRSALVRTAEDGSFVVRAERDHEVDPGAATDQPHWRALRSVYRHGLSITVDDVDVYRDCHGSPVTQVLSDMQADVWVQALGAAWSDLDVAGQDRSGWGTVISAATPLRVTPHCRPDPAACDRTLAAAGVLRSTDPGLLGDWLRVRAAHLHVNLFLDLADPTEPAAGGPTWPRVRLPGASRSRRLGTSLRDVVARIALQESETGEFDPAAPERQGKRHDRGEQRLLADLGALDHQVRWSRDGRRFLSGLRQRIGTCQRPAVEAAPI